ncbi:MAG TPA: PAS domain S-box protein, partial [Anaerolineales bacterium]|nr:PAS domain S-box protein [Anaerolineales bacterium]
IQVSSYRQDAYTENQLKLLESLALHIASAEQNAILYNQMLKELNERTQAEDALRASNETSQAILNASTESVFLMDTSGNVIATNETTAARLGKQVSDLAGTNMYDLIPESVGASRKKQMEMVIEKRKPVIFEDERFGVWLENSIYPIIDGDGTIRRVAVYGRDITDRKKAEYALRESEGRAQAMLQAIPDLMFRLNREGVFLDYKADAKDLHEQTVSLIGTRNRDIAPVEFADLIDHYIAKTLEANQLQTFEYQLPVPGKGLRDYEARMTPSGTDEVLAIVRDITERKQVEQNLRETQSRVELALKGANAGMWDWNVQTGETIFNERWAEIIGYALEEIEPVSIQTWADFCHPDDLEISDGLLKKHFAGETQFYECEVRMKHKNGSWVWVFDRGKVMEWDSEQRPLRMIGTHLDITERKQTEEALRAREELYRMISTINADYVFSEDVDMNGKTSTKWVGGGFEAITGYTFEEYSKQGGWLSILHPEDREKDAADFAALKKNQKIVSVLRMIAKNGDIRWVQVHANPLWDSELQCLTGVYGAVQDITERKKAEDALHASEEKYRVLIESLDNMIASVDNDGRFLYVNDMAAAQMHLTPNELIGKTMYELFPPEVTARQMSDIQRVIHGDQGITFEAPSFSSTAPRWYRTSILPIHDEDGLVTQVLINSTDIHNLKTAQQELQDLNRTLEERVKQRTAEVQDLYDNSPIGYHSLDADGTLLFINQTHLTWLGYTREEMIGHSITEFLTTSGLEGFKEIYPSFVKNGMVRDVESEFRRKDGSIVPVLISATAVYNEAGEFVMSRTSVFDNTGQKAAEQALRNANLELARAMRMKDEFLASMSHELRTPLTGILGLSEALQINVYGPINEKQQNTLANIEASGRHLLDLINDILDVSKIEAGKLELQMEACSLSEICQSSIQLTKGMAGKKRQTVNFTMNPANISVRGDARRLKQILVNLLSNSVKFTPEEGMLGLDVTANDSEGLVYISIWDKGIGITPEDLKKLFQPFVQLDSSLSRQQSGTGLGLALVQRLVELHGGSIDVQSVPGEGSRFTVTLPCQPADKASQEVENPSQLKFHQALIIEDTPADAEHLARYVKSLGITAIMHTSGKDAVERVIETQPDVVFLDLNLPEVSGWDVLTQIKNSRNTKHIPVVITSVDDDKSKASKLDADGYLVKFFTLSDLRTALSHIQKPSLASSEGHINPAAATVATIMIVDDNEVNINTLADFLAMQNFNIISVKSGVDFLAQAPHIHPDIVLMDIQMPGMDGLETTRRLRRLSDRRLASVPVVAITALAMPGDRERCIEAGADEYITKPFRLTEIHDLILKMVEERKSLTGG